MTAAVFVEAVDAMNALGWALRVWILLMAVTVTLAVYAVVVAVAWPCETACRAVAGALRAERALRALPDIQTRLSAAQSRLRPSWAQPDCEEAA